MNTDINTNTTTNTVTAIDPVIRRAETARMLGISTETLRLWTKGNAKRKPLDGFPQPIQIGARAIGWRLSEINAFIESRKLKQNETENESRLNSTH